jgi:hypothetical protein
MRFALARYGRASLGVLAFALAPVSAGCGDGPRTIDATASQSLESSEISIRFDVNAGRPTTVEVLAFRATTSVPPTAMPFNSRFDVLGIVDPLAAEPPGEGCTLRDIDLATKTLALRGGSIDLQELTGIGVGLNGAGAGLPGAALLRPFPRLFPDVATVVGGVVAEAGPQYLGSLPERVTLFSADSELPLVELAVPSAPRVLAVNGQAVVPGLSVGAQDGLAVTVTGAAGGRVELRPFGATIAATCTLPANATGEAIVNVPRAFVSQLAQLVRTTGAPPDARLPVSLEVARRVHLRQGFGPLGIDARLTVEVRSAATVELRP